MDISLALLLFTAVTCYLLWFTFISKSLKGPRVCLHEWIADNLCACGGAYQTCICAVPFLARKIWSIFWKPGSTIIPRAPTWQAVFHDLLGQAKATTRLFQRKTAALEFTTRTLHQAIKDRFCPLLKSAQLEAELVDLQDHLL